ncbi:PC-esterase domain-containing protein 1A-like [Lycorma delicatula]|uniref:PC-esterase domain-containing protein 1A-like n=1 Tax=Lycorma delicatula TaxID=130591 RepID=UPI003F514312
MADIFQQSDAKRLLKDKYVLFLGDSNIRALYKDLVWLLNSNTLVENHVLRRKLEFSFLGDKLVKRSDLIKGREYKEVREFENFGIKVEFHFLTRCYNEHVEELLKSFLQRKAPDVIYINSCLWDISRWGPHGVTSYKENIVKLMKMCNYYIPSETLVIWGTALPISSTIKSGFLIKQIEFLKHLLRFEVMEANTFARQVVVSYGYDVLDMHYYMRMQIHRRAADGVHYLNIPVRLQTNLILTHIALAWGIDLPGKIKNSLTDKVINRLNNEAQKVLDENIPSVLSQINAAATFQYGEYVRGSSYVKRIKRVKSRKKKNKVNRHTPY